MILISKIKRWLRLFRRRSEPTLSEPTLSIPQVDAWLANAVLRTLYQWHRQHGPGVWIIKEADLDKLAEWTRWLYSQHESNRRWAFWNRYKVRNIPEQLQRHY